MDTLHNKSIAILNSLAELSRDIQSISRGETKEASANRRIWIKLRRVIDEFNVVVKDLQFK